MARAVRQHMCRNRAISKIGTAQGRDERYRVVSYHGRAFMKYGAYVLGHEVLGAALLT